MKSLLFCCFFMSGCLMASGGVEATLPKQIIVSFNEHFNVPKQNGTYQGFKKGVARLFHENCIDSADRVHKERVKKLFKEIGKVAYNEGFSHGAFKGQLTGFQEGKAASEFYQQFYNSHAKKFLLASVSIILVVSLVYTGTKFFYCVREKYKKSMTRMKNNQSLMI